MPKALDELIDTKEPAWPLVKGWIAGARDRTVEVLDTTPSRGKEVLLALQVTTRSPMGTLAFQTGGLLIDSGWVRVFGGGCSRFEGDLARWNGLGPNPLTDRFDGAMLVGHDALGGFFAIDGGALGDGKGHSFYLAPDTLSWEKLTESYSSLLGFLLQGDLNAFYGELRWEGWKDEVKRLSPDRGFHQHPPLFTELEPGTTRSRKDVPMTELLALSLDFMEQLGSE
jgi:hypothetical protein